MTLPNLKLAKYKMLALNNLIILAVRNQAPTIPMCNIFKNSSPEILMSWIMMKVSAMRSMMTHDDADTMTVHISMSSRDA